MISVSRSLAENAIIVLGLLIPWPYIFGARGWAYNLSAIVVLALLLVVATARVRRIRQAFREIEAEARPARDKESP